MKIEIEVKFNISDKVLVKKPHSGSYQKPEPFVAVIGGYTITKNKRATTVRYTLEPLINDGYYHFNAGISDWNRKKKYGVNELEKIED